MRELLQVTGDLVTKIATIPVPTGKEVRIEAVVVNITGGNDGDQPLCFLAQPGAGDLCCAAAQLSAAGTRVTWGRGMQAEQIARDPVTGGSYFSPVAANGALPDVVWPFEIKVTLIGITPSAFTVLYSRDDVGKL